MDLFSRLQTGALVGISGVRGQSVGEQDILLLWDDSSALLLSKIGVAGDFFLKNS
jgi:hypothetical protein